MTKKTLKAILAAALAVIMVIPCFSAFAANDTLTWNYYGTEYYYDYAGEIENGIADIPDDASDYIYFTLDVPVAGYYSLTYSYDHIDAWIGVPESIENGIAYNELGFICSGYEVGETRVYQLAEGETIVALDLRWYDDEAALEVEFLGEEITSIETKYDLIYNYDIFEYEYKGEEYYEIEADFSVVFSEGKSFDFYYLSGEVDGKLTAGENTLKTSFFNEEKEFTVNVYYITDYVESVELSSVEDFLFVEEYYDGVYYTYPSYGNLKVTFKDGSTYTTSIDDEDNVVILPNGREVHYGFDYYSDRDDEYTFKIYVAGTEFASFECEKKTVSTGENIDAIKGAISFHLSDASYYLRRAFEVAFEDGFSGLFFDYNAEEAIMYITWSISSFSNVFSEIGLLLSYLIA